MKIEEGMYARTKNNGIVKIHLVIDNATDVYEDFYGREYEVQTGRRAIKYIDNKGCISYGIDENEIIKTGYNLIEVIVKDDILLSTDGKLYQCWKIYKDYIFTYSKNKQGQTITLVDYQINSVLTKEQFERMVYKVGE